MKRYEDIQQLADRFLDGQTSLDEERELARFFADHKAEIPSMPESLQILAEMFDGFCIATKPEAKTNYQFSILHYPFLQRSWRWVAAAACVAAVLAIALWPTDKPEPIAKVEPMVVTEPEVVPPDTIAPEQPKPVEKVEEKPVVPVHREASPTPSIAVAATPAPIPMISVDTEQEKEMAQLEAEYQKYKYSVTYVKI